MNDWHRHYDGRPAALAPGDQVECRLYGGGVVCVTIGDEPTEFWNNYCGDFDVVQWRLVNHPDEANPKPGDILNEAQSLRWMACNMDAGREPGDGLEWWSAISDRWVARCPSPVDALYFARNNRLRAALPKRRTVSIDGVGYPVPEPMTQVPELGQSYWFLGRGMMHGFLWSGDDTDLENRRENHIYATREQAEQALAIHHAIYGAVD